MFVVDNVVISDEIVNTYFACDIGKCKGACCKCGDSGAGVTVSEIDEIHINLNLILDNITEKALNTIKSNGSKVWDYDPIGRFVTLLQDTSECVFGYNEGSVLYCAIEKSYRDNKITFNKPLSCHLYPIKYLEYNDFEVLSMHKWDICDSAFENGKEQGVLVYEFAKEPLVRKFGKEWYQKLLIEIEKQKTTNN
jgi:Protein of unknown function (DUF3109)